MPQNEFTVNKLLYNSKVQVGIYKLQVYRNTYVQNCVDIAFTLLYYIIYIITFTMVIKKILHWIHF